MSKTGSKNSRGDSTLNSVKLSYAGSFVDENQSQNHNCLWRKSYEEEHQKRIESENSVIKYLKVSHTSIQSNLQKLEQEKDIRLDLEREIAMLKDQVAMLDQRNFLMENEIKGRLSDSKGITYEGNSTTILNSQSPEISLKKNLSRSPHRPVQMVRPAKLSGEDFGAPKANRNQRLTSKPSNGNQQQQTKKSDINFQQIDKQKPSKELQKQHQLILKSQDSQADQLLSQRPFEEVDFIAHSTRESDAIESAQINTNSSRYRSSVEQNSIVQSQISESQLPQSKLNHHRTQRMKTSEILPRDPQLNKQTSHGLSIQYKDNDDPNIFQSVITADNTTQQNQNKNNNRKLSGVRKYRSGDNFDFAGMQQTYEMVQAQSRFEEQQSLLNQQNTIVNQNPPYYVNQEKEQVKSILKHYKKQNLGFSKFKIISIDGEGKLERIKLKVDPIRIAQREYFSKMRKHRENSRKEQQVAKSMQFSDNQLSRPQLHQLQPSLMLRQDFDPKYQNLMLQNHEEFDEEGGVIIENEEDVLDCQEGNKTPFNQYSLSGKRNQVQFQSNEYNAIGRFQSPRRDLRQQLYLDDEEPVQTHRLLGNGFNEQDFEDQMLLETPIHRLGSNNSNGGPSGLGPNESGVSLTSEYDTFRAKQKCEYSNDQIKEMQLSIRNISTNKKQSRKQLGKVIPGNKLDKKNLESFRVIKEEEAQSLNLSGDEGCNDQQESAEQKADKSNSFGWGVVQNANIGEHSGMVKNPTYTRITHASKQMGGLPGGPFRLGTTMGYRNEGIGYMNPLMKSMPNMDFLREKDKSQSLPFDEMSGIIEEKYVAGGNHQHSNTYFDINNSSYINPIDSKLKTFSSPQNYKQSGIKIALNGPVVTDSPPQTKNSKFPHIFEEFFIIGTDQNDLNTLEWNKSDHQFVAPKTLYMYTENGRVNLEEECERRRVVKDFCFPDGIEVKMLKNSGESKSMIASKAQKILYSSKSVREQCFVFIMNANEDSISENSMMQQYQQLETFPCGSTQDKYYNCMCVVFNELISPPSSTRFTGLKGKELDKKFRDTKIYSTKKAYCFMFVNQYYQLHLDVINLLITSLKIERLKLSQELQKYDLNLIDQTYIDILSMLDLPLLSDELINILDRYFFMDIEEQLRFGRTISLEVGQDIGFIKYDLPPIADYSYLDCIWFCPTLFSLFSVDNMLKLLSAVMLEKSIVFIGKQGLLSSSILAFNTLLYPFKWCLALVPILPHPLIEMIEAPLPILVGITKREYREINLTKKEKESKIWVFLETGEILWNKDGMKVPRFAFSDIEEINFEYQNFKKAFEVCYTSTSGIESDRSSSVSAELENYQIYNDEVKYNCKRICEIIRKSIKTFILDSLKQSKLQRRGGNLVTKVENFVLDMGEIVVDKGRQEDKAFLQQFVETQMFATYIEENLK